MATPVTRRSARIRIQKAPSKLYRSEDSVSSSEDSDASDEQSIDGRYSFLEDEEVNYESLTEEINEEDFSDNEDVPDFDLPVGSDDIPLEPEELLDASEVFETCRTNFRLLLLSPFCFDDFVRVLRSPEQSRILAEIHIAFLKFVLRDDEEEQIMLASSDLNPSFSLLVALLEPMTYAEVLRQYVESDALRFPQEVQRILNDTNYPFCSARERLVVLRFLCSRFCESAIFRHSARQELKYKHDDYCRDCSLHKTAQSGVVYKCSFCEAIYHSNCLEQMNGSLPESTEDWECLICDIHKKTPGVSILDILPENSNLRLEQLGEDRHNRVYWFVGRRLLVVNPADRSVVYYSTLPQLYPLVHLIGDGRFEKRLHRRLAAEFDRIEAEMRTTMELTMERHTELLKQKPDITKDIYLSVDNVIRMAQILHKYSVGEMDNAEDELAATVRESLGIDEEGHLVENVWVGDYSEDEIKALGKELAAKKKSERVEALVQSRINGFRLGLIENDFRSYENQYACNDYARSPQLRAKERDRKKYLNGKFAFDVNFAWTCPKGRDLFGPAFQTAKSLQWTLDEVRRKIPKPLYHRLWGDYAEKFKAELDAADTFEKLKIVLLKLECAIRKPMFSRVWWNSLGHSKLFRYSVDDKDAKKKKDSVKTRTVKNIAKSQPTDDDSNLVWVKWRSGVAPKHALWRAKDEEYRLNGLGQLGGWLWQSRTWKRTFVDGPPRVPLGIHTTSNPEFQNSSPEGRAYRLHKLVEKLYFWRRIGDGYEFLEARYEERKQICYSPMCRYGMKYIAYGGPKYGTGYQQCYNQECRMVFAKFSGPTEGIAKIVRPEKLPLAKNVQRPKKRYGFEDPFPLSEPFTYKSRGSGRSSILNLKQPILRRLARQGGLSNKVFLHGFSRTAKQNPLFWNIPAPRPTFDNCWRYLTYNAKSLHAIALQLRIMFACIRWCDLEQEDGENKHIVHGVDGEEQRVVIGHRENPPDGYYEQYKVRIYKLKDADDLDEAEMDECDDSEDYVEGRIRSGRRAKRPKRSAKSQKVPKQTEVVERWIDGVDLKLWEIKNYWNGYSRRVALKRKPQDSPAPEAPSYSPTVPVTSTPSTPATTVVSAPKKVKVLNANGVAVNYPTFTKTVLPQNLTPVTKNGTAANVYRYVKVMNAGSNGTGRAMIPLANLDASALPLTYTVVHMGKANGVHESNGHDSTLQ